MFKILIHGHLTRDPEVRVTPKGTSICGFAVASNRSYKDEAGVVHEFVDYLEVVSFGKQGEVIAKNLSKGSEFMGTAELQQERWEDKTTKEKRNRHVAKLDDFEFCGKKVQKDTKESAAPAEPVAAGN